MQRYASAVYAVVVCMCVSVCHTPYCIRTAKRRIMQIMPHNSPGTQFSDAKDHGEILTVSHPMGATDTSGLG